MNLALKDEEQRRAKGTGAGKRLWVLEPKVIFGSGEHLTKGQAVRQQHGWPHPRLSGTCVPDEGLDVTAARAPGDLGQTGASCRVEKSRSVTDDHAGPFLHL